MSLTGYHPCQVAAVMLTAMLTLTSNVHGQAMGTSFFCMAALDGIAFPKALGIASSTYAQALKGRHQGQVASLKGKTLTDKEMFAAAEQQLLLRAMAACPKAIPDDVQTKINAAIKQQAGKS